MKKRKRTSRLSHRVDWKLKRWSPALGRMKGSVFSKTQLLSVIDSILREIERVLVLEDSEDELVEQFDDLVTIDIIDDENDNN